MERRADVPRTCIDSSLAFAAATGEAAVDMGCYEILAPAIEVYMKFTPGALNPYSSGRWTKAHFVLPEEFTVEDVDADRPARLTEPFEPDIEIIKE
jgi:hypothetical protein